MTGRHAWGLALLLATVALAGCGRTEGVDPTPHSEVTASGADVRLVGEEQADLVLHVSNQSFDDDRVRLTISVDGVRVVEGDFHVEDQHNWVTFPLSLPAGVHQVTAESDSGATLDESFRVPGGETRHAVIDHWGEDASAELTWMIQREPIAFA